MQPDTVRYDSLENRPLPKWLIDQRDGLNTYQPEILQMKEDRSLQISFISTGILILLTIVFLTVYFFRKNKKKKIL
jgi:hypothetical protein